MGRGYTQIRRIFAEGSLLSYPLCVLGVLCGFNPPLRSLCPLRLNFATLLLRYSDTFLNFGKILPVVF